MAVAAVPNTYIISAAGVAQAHGDLKLCASCQCEH